jgi:hypothetical protein
MRICVRQSGSEAGFRLVLPVSPHTHISSGHAVTYLVEALCYKPKGRLSRVPDEVDYFDILNLSSRTMALGSNQPVTEMSTRNLPGGEKRPARKVDSLAVICEPIV